ncbi:hypothetical protein DYU11_12320 [Fibrisoma montanum]|uniref:YceK/YidQ family lipoprotein n=1 Tax=Fibrisoma montanum TaxID=2305895 RepID=A0A418MBJ2_9BACT|nr:hypothetical protein [Fibrisoma montanum]RIV23753.1 hypothetical protein DYU11_12320 [Fibrisoma montanum]
MKSVKKFTVLALAALTLSGSLSSCATVFGGRVTAEQKRKPAAGEARREVRVGALIADILLFPLVSIPVDFATGAIYKPKSGAVAQQAPAAKPAATAAPKKK